LKKNKKKGKEAEETESKSTEEITMGKTKQLKKASVHFCYNKVGKLVD